MDYLNKVLLEKALKEEVFRTDEIEKIVRILVKESGLDDYVEEIIVQSFKKFNVSPLTCALYSDKRLYFDRSRTIHSNSIVQNIEGDNKSITYFINLNVIKVILHTLEFVLQEKKVKSGIDDMESYFLLKAYQRRQKLIEDGVYDSLYSLNPIFRQANIRSLKKVNDLARRNNVGPDYFNEELNKARQDGYSKGNPIEIYPCKTYFDMDLGFFDIEDLEDETKIELGLPVKKL